MSRSAAPPFPLFSRSTLLLSPGFSEVPRSEGGSEAGRRRGAGGQSRQAFELHLPSVEPMRAVW